MVAAECVRNVRRFNVGDIMPAFPRRTPAGISTGRNLARSDADSKASGTGPIVEIYIRTQAEGGAAWVLRTGDEACPA